jgi:hypothetical protein
MNPEIYKRKVENWSKLRIFQGVDRRCRFGEKSKIFVFLQFVAITSLLADVRDVRVRVGNSFLNLCESK